MSATRFRAKVNLKVVLVGAVLGFVGRVACANLCPTEVPDDRALRIHSSDDVARTREQLYEYIWGGSTLPVDDIGVTIETDVGNPIGCSVNLARVDALHTADAARGGRSILGAAWHFVPVQRNHRLVIVHNGHLSPEQVEHQCTDQFAGDESGTSDLGMQMTINALIADGFDVLAVAMPMYVPGQCLATYDVHDTLFTDPANAPVQGSPVRYFLDMTLRGINYLSSHESFADIAMVGLSGGGWATTLYSALDSRIAASFPVAGSLPFYLRNLTLVDTAPTRTSADDVAAELLPECQEQGDFEQHVWDLYRIAGPTDLYLLGGYGSGRRQVQILNRQDDCCWGQAQSASADTYDHDLRAYEARIRLALERLGGGGEFRLHVDEAAVRHQISRISAHDVVLAELNAIHAKVGADSGSLAFIRGSNGRLWANDGGGWRDLGFGVAGTASVVENALHRVQLAARDGANRAELIYLDGSSWSAQHLPTGGLPQLSRIASDPVLLASDSGGLDVFAQGSDALFYHWQVTSSGTTVQAIGGSPYAVGAPAVVSDGSGGHAAYFLTGESVAAPSGCIEQPRVVYALQQDDLGDWQPAARLGGNSRGNPAAGHWGGEQRTYIVDADAVAEHASVEGSASPWIALPNGGVQLAGSPGQPISYFGGETLYVRTAENRLGRLDYSGNAWSYAPVLDFEEDSSGSLSDSPRDTADGGVFWFGVDGIVHRYDMAGETAWGRADTLWRDDFENAVDR